MPRDNLAKANLSSSHLHDFNMISTWLDVLGKIVMDFEPWLSKMCLQ